NPHETHAALTARALRAGKHVFCEKPLALTLDELEEVEAAHRAGGGVLFVGFNGRWSEPVRAVIARLAGGTRPLSGHLPGQRRGPAGGPLIPRPPPGGRLLGEVCHFVDTCAAIAGADAVQVAALASGTGGKRLLDDHLVVSLRYGDGSLATITYAAGGHPSTPKERIEVLGRGRSAVIDDFRAVVLDGRPVKPAPRGKGHRAGVAEFRRLGPRWRRGCDRGSRRHPHHARSGRPADRRE
ncbi:MAG: Gfo/Idh/MocA family oxidoreductase, partial [Actinobacteria bacterium]|nr:Gfo/Idh/MocA family oxidoreductase [Actinomycetota bacterium]